MTVRSQLTEWLTEALPAGWKIIDSERSYDVLNQTTVIIKQQTIQKLPEAPQGAWSVAYTLTLVDPHKKLEDAEVALDEDVIEFFEILDGLPGVNPTLAQKFLVPPSLYLGYDVTVTVITKKDPS